MSDNDNFLPLVLINALGIAGIVLWHIQGENRPIGRLIVQILFFTGLSLVPFTASIAAHQPDGTRARARIGLPGSSELLGSEVTSQPRADSIEFSYHFLNHTPPTIG
ncbi:hypothetical protein [Rhizobium laguerreae]|uniref:hypothetical protein n=1 Tax=Rhizobium laguerreae TaxID=1076926 RepID=UPI001FEE10EF|nr:hypothetical protein [Rhizobium laguerreae]